MGLSSCDSEQKNNPLSPEDQLESLGIPAEEYNQQLRIEASNGTAKVIRLLLAADAQINSTDETGRTPLHDAARGGIAGIIRLLLNAGAKLNLRDNAHRTPLFRARRFNHNEAVSVLQKAGAVD